MTHLLRRALLFWRCWCWKCLQDRGGSRDDLVGTGEKRRVVTITGDLLVNSSHAFARASPFWVSFEFSVELSAILREPILEVQFLLPGAELAHM